MQTHIVIGAGILGVSAAYHLAKQGEKVLLVDDQQPGQATGAAAGIVCPWISQRRNKAWYALAKNGAKYYPLLIQELEELGMKDTGYERVGALSLHHDENKLQAMVERTLKRREDAPEIGDVLLLSPEETKQRFPALADGFGSVFVSGAARVDGRAIRDALLAAAIRCGAEVVHGHAALSVSDGKMESIKISDQTYEANSVLCTAGAWAPDLLAPLGINLKIHAQKAQILHLHLPEENTDMWPVVMPPSDQYIVAYGDGRIVCGATHENDVPFDTTVTAGGMAEILQKALEFAPGLAKAGILEARVGFRPHSPEFLPVFGEVPGVKGLFAANGLGASGLTMGPYIGSLLTDLVLGKPLEVDAEAYSLSHAL